MKRTLLTIILAGTLLNGCTALNMSSKGPLIVPAEGPAPGVPAEVEYADYWVRTSDAPDDIIMTPAEIEGFNETNPMNGEGIHDVAAIPDEIDGVEIRRYISASARGLLDNSYFISENIPLEAAERKRIVALMDTSSVPDVITPKKGLILRRVQTKRWPTTVLFTTTPGDLEFDSTVGSALDTGHPVALLHVSRDGRWSFVQNEIYSCWIPSNAVAYGDTETISALRDKSNPVVATAHRVSVFASPDDKSAVADIQMGSWLPLKMAGRNYCQVIFPGRGENNELVAKVGFVKRDSGISLGFLPYTLRNVYRQCFVPYGHRYGWAGMYEERDCSRLVMDVFRCFGFKMPRTSGGLLKASPATLDLKDYDRQTRLEILKSSPGGISIVGWPGHVMIYLGEINGTPYVVQSTWAMRQPLSKDIDRTHRLARVLVSDLFMGEGSQRGARIDRITNVTIFGKYTF